MNEKDNEGKLGNPEVLMDFYQGRTTNCLVLEGKELLRKEKKKPCTRGLQIIWLSLVIRKQNIREDGRE